MNLGKRLVQLRAGRKNRLREVLIRNEEETRAFGLALADELQPNDVLALIGDLGVGKTSLTKYIAEGLGVTEAVTSPTFTIVAEHHSGRMPLYHFDVYRLDSGKDMIDIGCDEYFDGGGVSVIEWADKVAEILPDRTKCIFMDYVKKDEAAADGDEAAAEQSEDVAVEAETAAEQNEDVADEAEATDGEYGEERVYRCTF